MKSKTVFQTILSVVLIFAIQSCVPDPPPKPAGYVLKKSNNIINPAGTNKYAEAGPNCPREGDDCIVPVYASGTNTRELVINEWVGFKSYYDNNNVPAYFQQTHSWETLFPAFSYQPEIVNNIINGTFRTHIFSDSTIVVYKNNDYYNDNLVFTVRIN